jgi:hypothetical protein
MRRRRWMLVGLVLASLSLAVLAVRYWPVGPRSVSATPPAIQPLAQQGDIVGEWDRVEFPDAVIPVNWRKFSETGGFQVLYGDVMHSGTYRFVDPNTIETEEGNNGVHRWTVGWADEKLVLISQKHGWVEQYIRVPVGSFPP